MEKYLICDSADRLTGKTTTLLALCHKLDDLVKSGSAEKLNNESVCKNDLLVIYKLASGKTVMVQTAGDPVSKIFSKTDELLSKYTIDILVCASRNKGTRNKMNTIKQVRNWSKKYEMRLIRLSHPQISDYDGSSGDMDRLVIDPFVEYLFNLILNL